MQQERPAPPFTWKHIEDELRRVNAFLVRTNDLPERGPGEWWKHAYEVKLNHPRGQETTGINVLLYSERLATNHPDAKYLVYYQPSTRRAEDNPLDEVLRELHLNSRWHDFLSASDLKRHHRPAPKGIPMP